LYITDSQRSTDVVSIGELAYYGYIDGTITANHLTVAGGVGIGTDSPQYKLDVNSGRDVMLRVMPIASTSGKLLFGRQGTTDIRSSAIEVYNASGANNNYMKFLVHDGTGISPYETRKEVMTLVGNGNVGIGTTTPQEKLSINGSILLKSRNDDDGGIIFERNTATFDDPTTHRRFIMDTNAVASGLHPGNGNDHLYFRYTAAGPAPAATGTSIGPNYGGTAVTNLMTLNQTGNVGIGTTNPTAKLDVAGNIKCSGNIVADGTLTTAISIAAGKDTETTSFFGRSLVGSWSNSGGNALNDFAIFSHHDRQNERDFAVMASAGGTTYLNAKADNVIRFRINNDNKMTLDANGNLGINNTSPSERLHVGGTIKCTESLRAGLECYVQNWVRILGSHAGIYWEQWGGGWSMTSSTYVRVHNDRWIYTAGGVQCTTFRINGFNNKLEIRAYVENIGFYGDAGLNGFIEDDTQSSSPFNFTGQHRTFIKDIPHQKAIDYEGYIVCADQNRYVKMANGVETGNKAITINESLPIVSLSKKVNDKSCFGVISTTEDPDTRTEKNGKFVSLFKKESGDTRTYINSVGEGAVWIVDTNGPLESGDYITTSSLQGYGQKQNSDSLKNYTVAKITMDCDFNPQTQKVKKIKQALQDVTYWVKTESMAVTKDEIYDDLAEEDRELIEIKYYVDENEVEIIEEKYNELTEEEKENYSEQTRYIKHIIKKYKEKFRPKSDIEKYTEETHNELANVLDENGEFQWEETDETETAYIVKYLDENGGITDKGNHEHVAAFVGCTYHCG
jgi:hypothetical protein